MENTIFRYYTTDNAGRTQRDEACDAIASFVAGAIESEVNIRRQRLAESMLMLVLTLL